MNATDVARAALAAAPGALVVSSLGTATSAVRAASGDGPHLYLSGSMGSSLAVAIGVAHKRSACEVIVILGDGEAVMGASSLWTLAGLRPAHLLAIVLADGRYSITGDQPLAVPQAFAEAARALGLSAAVATTSDEVDAAVRSLPRPAVLEARYDDRTWPGPSPFVDAPVVRWRFEREATPERRGDAAAG